MTQIITSANNKNALLNKLSNRNNPDAIADDEVLWTALFAARALENPALLPEPFRNYNGDFWLEAQPLPPLASEGNTNLDFAFGDIGRRGDTCMGIEYDAAKGHGYVVFGEAKFFSDIDTKTTHDPQRNQMVRVIENLLTFQDVNGNLAPSIYFMLLTPEIFTKRPTARLYGFKFQEFSNQDSGADSILKELKWSAAAKRADKNWKYPGNITERIEGLTMAWISFESVISDIEKESHQVSNKEFRVNFGAELSAALERADISKNCSKRDTY